MNTDPLRITRRRLLASSGAGAGAAALAPVALARRPGLCWLPSGDDRCLVVVELEGGNDGLNTVIPIEDPAWRRARPRLASVAEGAHPIGGGLALHPAMGGLRRLVADELVAVVQGVGYRGSSRSHFECRDVWHTADPAFAGLEPDTAGWLGKAADLLAAAGAAVPGVSVGSPGLPLALRAKSALVPVIERIEDYSLAIAPEAAGGDGAGGGRQRTELRELVLLPRATESELGRFLRGVAGEAFAHAERLRRALAGYRAKAEYPSSRLGRRFQLLARIVASGFGTRLFHVGFSGFDTHATQLPAHAALLGQLSAALAALIADLRAHDRFGEVLILVHSEFGRRLEENRSGGTDHGKAGPVFLLGADLRPGVHGDAVDLEDLDAGDPRATTDFRKVYAAALRWLGVPPDAILGGDFSGLDVLR